VSKTSPTQRSLKKLRDDGYIVAVVEKWVPSGPAGFKGPIITRDVWNFGDILACKVGQIGATLVQTTSGTHVAERLEKMRSIAEVGIWIAAGNRVVVHGWRKVGDVGKRKVWECREVNVG